MDVEQWLELITGDIPEQVNCPWKSDERLSTRILSQSTGLIGNHFLAATMK